MNECVCMNKALCWGKTALQTDEKAGMKALNEKMLEEFKK